MEKHDGRGRERERDREMNVAFEIEF